VNSGIGIVDKSYFLCGPIVGRRDVISNPLGSEIGMGITKFLAAGLVAPL